MIYPDETGNTPETFRPMNDEDMDGCDGPGDTMPCETAIQVANLLALGRRQAASRDEATMRDGLRHIAQAMSLARACGIVVAPYKSPERKLLEAIFGETK